jgi:hypothetical protein
VGEFVETLRFSGDVVEWDELLNGTQLVTIEGASDDGQWTLTGLLTWNIGIEEREAEGDVTLTRADGAAVFGSARSRRVTETEGESAFSVNAEYEVDGGEGAFEGASGRVTAGVQLDRAGFSGEWRVKLTLP